MHLSMQFHQRVAFQNEWDIVLYLFFIQKYVCVSTSEPSVNRLNTQGKVGKELVMGTLEFTVMTHFSSWMPHDCPDCVFTCKIFEFNDL